MGDVEIRVQISQWQWVRHWYWDKGTSPPFFDEALLGVLGPLVVVTAEAKGPMAEEEEVDLAFFFFTTFVGP